MSEEELQEQLIAARAQADAAMMQVAHELGWAHRFTETKLVTIVDCNAVVELEGYDTVKLRFAPEDRDPYYHYGIEDEFRDGLPGIPFEVMRNLKGGIELKIPADATVRILTEEDSV